MFAFLLCGCGVLDAGTEGGGDGYLLYEDVGDANAVEGIVYVEFVDKGDGQIEGSMQWATPGEPNVYLRTAPITGTVDGTNIAIEEELPAQGGAPDEFIYVEYQGTLEGDTMSLTRATQGVIIKYEGDEATLEDFGAAAEELAMESE